MKIIIILCIVMMRSDTDTTLADLNECLNAIRANDENALRHLYQTNYRKVEKYVLDNNGSHEEAKDVFQEAFIAAWRNIQLDRFQMQQGGSLDAYLFRIAKNKWLDHLRSVKKNQRVLQLTDESNEIEEIRELAEEEQELLKKIKENFRLLGQLCRDVLERFYFYRQSMRTISEALNWTEATARNNKYRCLQQLRKLVNPKNPDDE